MEEKLEKQKQACLLTDPLAGAHGAVLRGAGSARGGVAGGASLSGREPEEVRRAW